MEPPPRKYWESSKQALPPIFIITCSSTQNAKMVSKYLKFSAGLGREMVREVSYRNGTKTKKTASQKTAIRRVELLN